jgi:hypothetical protein
VSNGKTQKKTAKKNLAVFFIECKTYLVSVVAAGAAAALSVVAGAAVAAALSVVAGAASAAGAASVVVSIAVVVSVLSASLEVLSPQDATKRPIESAKIPNFTNFMILCF